MGLWNFAEMRTVRADARGRDGCVRKELAQKPGTAMRDRHRGRPRQMMPLERTGAFTLDCVAVLLVVALA